jgi:hypothetical protein
MVMEIVLQIEMEIVLQMVMEIVLQMEMEIAAEEVLSWELLHRIDAALVSVELRTVSLGTMARVSLQLALHK